MSNNNGDLEKKLKALKSVINEAQSQHAINMEGTSKETECPNCGSWINHWKTKNNISKEGEMYCSIVGCNETNELVGGHVTLKGDSNNTPVIIPLCKQHNHYTEFEKQKIQEGAKPVPVSC